MTTLRRALRLPLRWLGRPEGVVLFVAFLLALAVTGFIELADEVVEGETRNFDEWLLRLLREPDNPRIPRGPLWLMEAAHDVTALGGRTALTLVVLIAMGYLGLDGKPGGMWLVALAAAGGGLLSTAMKNLFARDRPDIVPHMITVASPSFPSGHSMLAAVVYLTLGALMARFLVRRRVRVYVLTVALVLTLLVGASRVYLGVHHPTDVLSGWTAGLAWALVCWLVARYLQRRGKVEPPS
jgi:undecaprenyl-diphosphatase